MDFFNKYNIAEMVYYFVQPNHEYNGFWRIKERMKTSPHLNREDNRQEYVYKLERRTSSSSSISISWIKEEDLFKTKEESEIEYYKRLENKKKEEEEKRKDREERRKLQLNDDPFGEEMGWDEWNNKRPRQNRARNEGMITKFKSFEQNWWENDPFGEENGSTETEYKPVAARIIPTKKIDQRGCRHDFQLVKKTVYDENFKPIEKYFTQCVHCKKIEKEYLETPKKLIDRWGNWK